MKNRKPPYQKVFRWVGFFFIGIFVLGSLLDAFSNAIAVVSPLVTYIGSGVIVFVWLVVEIITKSGSLIWISRDQQKVTIKGLGVGTRMAILGVISLLWLPRIVDVIKQPDASTIEIPLVIAKIINETDSTVTVFSRGEFMLWLPQGFERGFRTVPGKYEIIHIEDNADIQNYTFQIEANKEVFTSARLLGQEGIARYFQRGDTDLTLTFYWSGGGRKLSQMIPFTAEALDKNYVEVSLR